MPFWVAMDRPSDCGNLGAIIRSSIFFGADGIVVTERDSAPLGPAVSKSSAGAMEIANIHTVASLSRFLQKSKCNGWLIVGADVHANSISLSWNNRHEQLMKPLIVVFGNESSGLRKGVKEQCDFFITINGNTSSFLDSLNVSSSASIILQYLREMRK